MHTYTITAFLLLEAIALVTLILAVRDAKDGWEDEAGFHLSAAKQTRSRARFYSKGRAAAHGTRRRTAASMAPAVPVSLLPS